MKKLCFGTYGTVLKLCKVKSTTQKVLCGTIALSVAPPEYDIRTDDGAVRDLLSCKNNLSPYVTEPALTADAHQVAEYFKNNVLPLLDENKWGLIVLAIKDLLNADTEIGANTTVDKVTGMTKKDIENCNTFALHNFLAGVFLYIATATNNGDGKPCIKEITVDYINGFSQYTASLSFVEKASENKKLKLMTSGLDSEMATEIAGAFVTQLTAAIKPDDSLFVTLLSEANGNCLRCGKKLGVPKRNQIPVGRYEIVYLKQSPTDEECYENAVVLCSDDCAPTFPLMKPSEIKRLLDDKHRCAETQAYLERISSIKFPDEIESVLRELHNTKNDRNLERTDIKDLVEIDRKIDEPFLKDKINASMARLYKTVVEICGRLEQEISFDTNMFGNMMKAAQQLLEGDVRKKADILDPQEYIANLLIEKLFSQVGQKHKDACEIVVGYLIKRCDLFNENAQQG